MNRPFTSWNEYFYRIWKKGSWVRILEPSPQPRPQLESGELWASLVTGLHPPRLRYWQTSSLELGRKRGTPSGGIWWKLFRQQLILWVPLIFHAADDHDLGHDLTTKFSGLGTTETQRKAWVSGMVQTYVSLPEFMCWNPPPPKAIVLGTGASGNWWGHVGGASDRVVRELPRPCHQVTSQQEDEEPSTQQAQNHLAPACWTSQPLGTVRKCW